MRRVRFALVLTVGALLVTVAAGCQEQKSSDSAPASAPAPAPAARAPEVLRSLDRAGFDSLVAHQPKKIILVGFWATWCGPSRREFPEFAALAAKYAPDGLVSLSIACDDAEKAGAAQEFLNEQKTSFQHVRSAHGAAPRTFEDFEIDGNTLPHYKLYDRKGALHKTFAFDPDSDEPGSLDAVEAAIRELLEEPE